MRNGLGVQARERGYKWTDYPPSPKGPPELMSACHTSLFTLVTHQSPGFQVTHHQWTLLHVGHCTHLTGPTFYCSWTIQTFLPCPVELTDVVSRTPLPSNSSECSRLCFSQPHLGPQVNGILSTPNRSQCPEMIQVSLFLILTWKSIPLPDPTKIQLFKEHALEL